MVYILCDGVMGIYSGGAMSIFSHGGERILCDGVMAIYGYGGMCISSRGMLRIYCDGDV